MVRTKGSRFIKRRKVHEWHTSWTIKINQVIVDEGSDPAFHCPICKQITYLTSVQLHNRKLAKCPNTTCAHTTAMDIFKQALWTGNK